MSRADRSLAPIAAPARRAAVGFSEPPVNRITFVVVGVTTLAAVLLYLDRVCISEVLKYDEVRADLGINADDVGWTFSAFFWAYALAQVPAGWLADRYGARGMMVMYLVAWSACTAMCGAAVGFASLFILRLGVGVAQAGAYPTSGGLLRNWVPFQARGLASSVVAFGGRLGGVIAQYGTALLIVWLGTWRGVLALYGVLGIAAAWMFWVCFRNRPADHPWIRAQANLANGAAAPSAPTTMPSREHGRAERLPLGPLTRSLSMWLMCVSQFTTNIGWVFLITWLPTYLKEAKHVSDVEGAQMAGIPLFVGMAGMLCGGWLTDWSVRLAGLRWGRALPLAGSRLVAAAAYLACPWIDGPWGIVAALCVVAFATDLGVGATWGFMQDVGGRSVGAVLGWGNMFGNFGAAVAPPLVRWVNKTFDSNQDWHEAFFLMSASFLLSGLAAMGINAARPVTAAVEND